MKIHKSAYLVAGMLVAGAPLWSLDAASPKETKPGAAKEEATTSKEALKTVEFLKGSKLALAAGHKFVRLGPNETAVYMRSVNTGLTAKCGCNKGTGTCSMTISGPLAACKGNCTECTISVSYPPSKASIFREIKTTVSEKSQ
jgi:hypothetical protein